MFAISFVFIPQKAVKARIIANGMNGFCLQEIKLFGFSLGIIKSFSLLLCLELYKMFVCVW